MEKKMPEQWRECITLLIHEKPKMMKNRDISLLNSVAKFFTKIERSYDNRHQRGTIKSETNP
jgi:hypothetical protein